MSARRVYAPALVSVQSEPTSLPSGRGTRPTILAPPHRLASARVDVTARDRACRPASTWHCSALVRMSRLCRLVGPWRICAGRHGSGGHVDTSDAAGHISALGADTSIHICTGHAISTCVAVRAGVWPCRRAPPSRRVGAGPTSRIERSLPIADPPRQRGRSQASPTLATRDIGRSPCCPALEPFDAPDARAPGHGWTPRHTWRSALGSALTPSCRHSMSPEVPTRARPCRRAGATMLTDGAPDNWTTHARSALVSSTNRLAMPHLVRSCSTSGLIGAPVAVVRFRLTSGAYPLLRLPERIRLVVPAPIGSPGAKTRRLATSVPFNRLPRVATSRARASGVEPRPPSRLDIRVASSPMRREPRRRAFSGHASPGRRA